MVVEAVEWSTVVADTTVSFDFDAAELNGSPREHESTLVLALRHGVESAYETLIARFEQPVFNIVSRLMNDPGDAADASDVVQEVFLKVFRNINSFRQDASLKTWIYRIAVNEARNHRRWFSRHRRREIGLESENGADSGRSCEDWLPDPGRSPFDAAVDQETHAMIEDALAQVNPTFRAALILREMEGLSYDEIGEVLNISLGTVKSRILRGRDALRKNLAERMEPGRAPHWFPQVADERAPRF
jgi:RNA polymerase sigma-70 factor (ECF subfamily)